LYYRPAAGGGFTVTASSSDGESGVSYSFPTLPAGWSASGTGAARSYTYTASPTAPSGPQNVTATNGAGLTASTAITFTADSTGPTGQTVTLSGGPWYTTTSIPLVLANGSDTGAGVDASSGVVLRASATLTGGVCGSFGSYSPVTLVGGADTTVTSGNCYRYQYKISDNVGNQSAASAASADAKVDTTAPSAPGLSYSALSAMSASGNTLYYRPAAGGGFTVTASSSDGESGVSYSFPTLPAGWSASGTGAARSYTYTASPTAPSGPQNVTATNGAGLTASTAITFTADSTGPTGQTVTLSGGPWYTTTSIPLVLANGSDTGAGVDASSGVVLRASATLTGGVCGSFGSYSPVTLVGGADTTVTSGNCYRYQYKISDNVGNQSAASAASADAKVDTTAPSAPGLSYSALSAMSASGNTLYYRPAAGGGFTVTASSSDGESGVSYSFPTLPAGWSASGTGAARSYTYTASPTAPSGPQNVTATNGAGLTASTAITFTADSTGPTGQTVTLSGGPWYTTTSIPLVLANGSDTGAGVDASSGVVLRASATLTGGVCGSFGSYSPVTLVGGADTTVTSGNCYRYQYKISDNVGNQSAASAASADAKVDTTAPSAPGLSYSALSAMSASGNTLYYRPAAGGGFTVTASSSDGESGVSYSFPTLPAGWSASGTGAARSYTYTASPTAPSGPQNVTATNGAGLTASTAITFTADSTGPTGQTVTLSGGPWYTTTSIPLVLANGSDTGAGVDASSGVVLRASATLTGGVCGSFGSYSPVTLVGGADTTVTSGNCYRYQYKISDNVGNQSAASAASADAKVDTTAPSAPGLSYSALSAMSATGNTLYYRPAAGGGFTGTASSSDGESGVSYSFPTLPAGWSASGTGAARSYTYTASPTAPSGPQNFTADSTGPTGQTVTLSGGPWYTTTSIPLVLANGSDTGAGVDASSGVVLRASATLTGGVCGSFGSYSPVTLVGGADTTVTSGNCYRYQYKISDNVGNQSAASAASADAKVDTTAPSAP